MDYTYKIYVYDEIKKNMFDYCYASLCKVLEDTEDVKVKDDAKIDSNYPDSYTKNKFKLMRMCAPDEIQIQEMIDDILQYYENYFAFKDNKKKINTIEITVNCHKFSKDEFADANGSCIEIWYFSIFNSLFSQTKNSGDELKDVVGRVWKDSTKDIFVNQIRYVMAHELFHALNWGEIKSGTLEEMAAEYFALSYINDFCNSTGQSQSHLVLRGKYSAKNKENGEYQVFKKDIRNFHRGNDEDGIQNGDYYGGAILLSYAFMTKKMYKENPYYLKIFEAVQESDCRSILGELVELSKQLSK